MDSARMVVIVDESKCPRELAERLCKVPGVMEHGLFIGNADTVIVAAAAGIRLMKRPG